PGRGHIVAIERRALRRPPTGIQRLAGNLARMTIVACEQIKRRRIDGRIRVAAAREYPVIGGCGSVQQPGAPARRSRQWRILGKACAKGCEVESLLVCELEPLVARGGAFGGAAAREHPGGEVA